MTCIAYKDNIIAYDSLMTKDNIATCLEFDKHFTVDNKHYFLAGNSSEYVEFLNIAQGINQVFEGLNVECIMYDGIKVYHCAVSDVFWKTELSEPFSIGTGAPFAFAAMDCGLSAQKAVRVACERDLYSGGHVRIFKTD